MSLNLRHRLFFSHGNKYSSEAFASQFIFVLFSQKLVCN